MPSKKKQGQNADPTDIKRFNYRNDPYYKRLARNATTVAVQTIIGDIMTGKSSQYSKMSKKKDIIKKVGKMAGLSVANTAIADKLAESAMNRYTDSGRLKKKSGLLTKEDVIEIGIGSAAAMAPALSLTVNLKLSSVAVKNKANRERFEAWGGNILNEKVDNVIWQSDDLKTAVIDNRR